MFEPNLTLLTPMSVQDCFTMFPLILMYGIMYRDTSDRNAVFDENRWMITK